jgi:hypothetical protein
MESLRAVDARRDANLIGLRLAGLSKDCVEEKSRKRTRKPNSQLKGAYGVDCNDDYQNQRTVTQESSKRMLLSWLGSKTVGAGRMRRMICRREGKIGDAERRTSRRRIPVLIVSGCKDHQRGGGMRKLEEVKNGLPVGNWFR